MMSIEEFDSDVVVTECYDLVNDRMVRRTSRYCPDVNKIVYVEQVIDRDGNVKQDDFLTTELYEKYRTLAMNFCCTICYKWFSVEEQLAQHKVECDASEVKRKEKWLRFIEAYKALLTEYDVDLTYVYAEGTEHTIDGKKVPYDWDGWSI